MTSVLGMFPTTGLPVGSPFGISFSPSLGIGDLGTWVSGIATAIAVIISLYYSHRQTRREDERKLHALYAWAERIDESTPVRWKLAMRNETPLPIYAWSLRVVSPDGRNLEGDEPYNNETSGLLTPGPSDFDDWAPPADFFGGESSVQVSIRFKDVRGVWMTRDHTGGLAKG